jgi:hypothetical protein
VAYSDTERVIRAIILMLPDAMIAIGEANDSAVLAEAGYSLDKIKGHPIFRLLESHIIIKWTRTDVIGDSGGIDIGVDVDHEVK